MKTIASAYFVAFALLASVAQGEELRTTVPIPWVHLPRHEDTEVYAEGRVPGALIQYARMKNGRFHMLALKFEDGSGQFCTAFGATSERLALSCGAVGGYFDMIKKPGAETTLEFVTEAPAPSGKEAHQ